MGNGTSKMFSVSLDVQKLGKQLIIYFYNIYKNFKFVDFYQKNFLDGVKLLIKTDDQFLKFLEISGMQMEQFFKLAIYICPNAFTSNLIKFIRENYNDLKQTSNN